MRHATARGISPDHIFQALSAPSLQLLTTIVKLLRPLTLWCILALLAVTGCKLGTAAPDGRDATLGEAQAFLKSMTREMQGFGSMTYNPSASGQAGKIKTADSYFTLDASEVSADDLYKHAERAFNAWGQYGAFKTRGHGGGGNHFGLHFGNQRTHAFVDMIAREKDGKTTIECLVRVVEP